MSAQVRISPDGTAVAVKLEGQARWTVLEGEWNGSWRDDDGVADWEPMAVVAQQKKPSGRPAGMKRAQAGMRREGIWNPGGAA